MTMVTIDRTTAQEMATMATADGANLTRTRVQLTERLMAALEYERQRSGIEEPIQVTWRRGHISRQLLFWRRGTATDSQDAWLENPENEKCSSVPFHEVFLPAPVALRLEMVAKDLYLAAMSQRLIDSHARAGRRHNGQYGGWRQGPR
jgi:hypothetical protein